MRVIKRAISRLTTASGAKLMAADSRLIGTRASGLMHAISRLINAACAKLMAVDSRLIGARSSGLKSVFQSLSDQKALMSQPIQVNEVSSTTDNTTTDNTVIQLKILIFF